jgi:hypothetical protein
MGMVYMVLCTVFANRARSLVEIKSFEHRIYLFYFCNFLMLSILVTNARVIMIGHSSIFNLF